MKTRRKLPQENFVWISYSDLSTTLMLCFILIFLVTLYERDRNASMAEKYLEQARGVSREIVEARKSYIESLNEIVKRMKASSRTNGCQNVEWNVDETRDSIQIFFRSDEGWFKDGSPEISKAGHNCLESFAAAWLLNMYLRDYNRGKIDRLIIEGHSNSLPPVDKKQDPYLYNLGLSQKRAYSAAEFIFKNLREDSHNYKNIPDFKWDEFAKWRRQLLTATGRGSSDPMLKAEGTEDTEKSKRIEFKFTIKHDLKGYKKVLENGV